MIFQWYSRFHIVVNSMHGTNIKLCLNAECITHKVKTMIISSVPMTPGWCTRAQSQFSSMLDSRIKKVSYGIKNLIMTLLIFLHFLLIATLAYGLYFYCTVHRTWHKRDLCLPLICFSISSKCRKSKQYILVRCTSRPCWRHLFFFIRG